MVGQLLFALVFWGVVSGLFLRSILRNGRKKEALLIEANLSLDKELQWKELQAKEELRLLKGQE